MFPVVDYVRSAIHWLLPVLYVLISNSFYLRTYDSAQVKITLLQMGGLALITLWTCLLAMEGRKAIYKADMVFLAPFLLYALYIILSFLNAPYKWLSVDDFVRYLAYMGVSLIVISEFDEAALKRFTKIFIFGAIITVLYGVVQIVDWQFFPREAGMGLDPFLWRGAFGARVFSTYGNPNFFADFVLIMFFVFVSQYLKKRSFWYLPVIAADLACLYFTETKGAWMGFGIAFVIFVAIYSVFFLREYYERYKVWINSIAITVLVSTLLVVGIFAHRRMTSVSFRVFTWLSAWEMIETKPLTGTGVGSFKVVYPAFRRPQIFHIEGKHNTETDHSEDEYLEQWFDNGILGFGLFLWIVVFTVTTGLRALGSQTMELGKTGQRAPPQAYDLLGYLTAFTAMMTHNFFDVSMRFVSSGIYLGLLPGLVIALSRGHALYEVHSAEVPAIVPAGNKEKELSWLWLLRLVVIGGLGWLFWTFCVQFNEVQGPLDPRMVTGDSIQWHLAWVVFVVLGGWLVWKFVNVVWRAKTPLVMVLVLAMLYPMNLFWGFFRANVYHNLAIYFSKNKDWDHALDYYNKTSKYDPSFVMAYYFRGNVFKDRFDETRQYRPEWGDTDEKPRTDYERALDDYGKLRALAPNYVQTYYQLGELYMKRSDELAMQKDSAGAAAMLDKSLYDLTLYHNLDPVFPYTYYHRARIYEVRGQFDKARQEYEDNINAPDCHEKGHMHENAEAYIYLGMFDMRQNHLDKAEADFKRAVELEPDNPTAKGNYQAILNVRRNGAQVRMQPSSPGAGVHITLPPPQQP